MAEWLKAAVLKTVIPKGIGGSNPSLSANPTKSYLKSKTYKSDSEFANNCEQSSFSQCDCDSSVSAVL